METFNHAHGTILATYRVNYLYGLSEKKKIITSIQMHVTDKGLLFKKRGFDLYIDYGKVKRFELVKGSGSFWSASLIWDQLKAKLFEITYFNNSNQQICVCFEMKVSKVLEMKNYTACEELLLFLRDNRLSDIVFMKNNGIFDKFVPAPPPSPSVDILTQIEKLAALHQSGALTDEEFQSKKAELLNRL